MAGLKVICLISGGKDSLFSILHCLKNGHEVVALANLHPPIHKDHGAAEDLDSYMYQTIGHGVIGLYEQALGLPVYRQEIFGAPVNQDKWYGVTSEQDETEALIPLLRRIQAQHPEVNAISTGAILSDYQRTRVESVALRIGLTPLSYLWQWPNLRPHTQDSLLQDMSAVGQDSRIIKVASGGLDDTFLWQNVADSRTIARLKRAVQRFGSADDGAVLGEGGEYETLVVSGPSPLWKGRIAVDEGKWEVVAGEAGSSSARILEASVQANSATGAALTELHVPALLEPRLQRILEIIQHEQSSPSFPTGQDSLTEATPESEAKMPGSTTSTHGAAPDHVLLTNLVGDGNDAAEQMRSIMEQMSTTLHEMESSFQHVAYTSIVLRDLADFVSINDVYGSYFTHPNPPARATIACADVLPPGKHLLVSLTVLKSSTKKVLKGLHVQSRSYWAPPNIGPYSQAIAAAVNGDTEAIYIAGQVPLVPYSMQMVGHDDIADADAFLSQAVLALQHADRIGRAMRVQRWLCAIAFIVASGDEEAVRHSRYVRRAWDLYHYYLSDGAEDADPDDDEESFDVWHSTHGSERSYGTHKKYGGASHSSQRKIPIPAVSVISVDALPRGASIEWVPFGLTSSAAGECSIPHVDHLLQLFRTREVMC